MLFREYGAVKAITICAESCRELNEKIEDIGIDYDVIDLQFATCYDTDERKVVFSALLLIRVK